MFAKPQDDVLFDQKPMVFHLEDQINQRILTFKRILPFSLSKKYFYQ